MSSETEIKNYCLQAYDDFYKSEYNKLLAETTNKSKKDDLSHSKHNEIETTAQKYAIKQSIIHGMQEFPDHISLLWHSIYEAHVYRKSGISDLRVIQEVVSADQSWKKSSGHAFEEMIKELATLAMGDLPIQFILQRDLNTLIKAGEIANEPRDISWLKEQIKGNIFDLFVVTTYQDKLYCIGCVQCKTSIRDRVTRDREPSIHAMSSYFWSIVFVLDGEYLKNPKFQHMVNGGSKEFPTNGWHGMYDVSASYNLGRIYPLDMNFDILRKHSEKAVNDWLKQRQWFNNDWCAD